MTAIKYNKKEYSVRDSGCKKLITECFIPFSGNGQNICRSFEMGQCPKKVKASVSKKELKRRLKKNIKEAKMTTKVKDKILEEYKKGNIVVAGIEGLQTMPLDEFIKQSADGMLYDLNRDEATVLTFIEDPKWINDYAVCKVVNALKKRIEELEQKRGDK